ncbi:MAG TPA: metallophosphoesterase family protein [Acidocella sp.]|nr:MAG: hypothetical protein B7Z77_04845 [Acidocella sp. 20-58-15]HQT38623.1 metallophosphoesterase family protein [Acidocella sp.]
MKLHLEGKLLAFGGCYSNLQATQALLARADDLGIRASNIICTGDIVAYGADAHATLALIRSAGISVLMGNCEEALSRKADHCGCGFAPGSVCDALASQWYAYAAADIDDDDRGYMANLPADIEVDLAGKKLKFVHGNVDRINAFVFPSASHLELKRQIDRTGCDAVIAGHAGIPFTRDLGGKIWHNAGSIGMPANDGTPRGWFSTIEVCNGDIVITSYPLHYDHQSAAASMRRARLPEDYAVALETGVWPSLDILPAFERYFTGTPLEHRQPEGSVPIVPLQRLATLWVNTGTLCNLSCANCFMDSTPSNDSLEYFTATDFQAILAQAPASLGEIGFTGGEPFMNPDIIVMLECCLQSGLRALVLSNAMRPLQRHKSALMRLIDNYPGRLRIRVSIDHYRLDEHDTLRGTGSFVQSLDGLKFLETMGLEVSVAARTPWGETEAMMRHGFAELFSGRGIGLNAYEPGDLILFPEMDVNPGEPMPVTNQALSMLQGDKPLMCRDSRMVVRRKGEAALSFTPCTLLPGVDIGASLAEAEAPVALRYAHCGQFCVYGGASCAGAPG